MGLRMNVQTYLFFDGECEAALELYGRVFGVEPEFVVRFKDAPHANFPAEFADKIFHSTVKIGETPINLSDDMSGARGRFGGFALLVHLETIKRAEAVFNGLADDGTVDMPMQQTFWASRYGIVTDRFGVTWKVQSSAQ